MAAHDALFGMGHALPSCYRPTATDALPLSATYLLYVHEDTLLVHRADEPHGVRRRRGLLGLRFLGVSTPLLLASEQVRDLARLRVNLRVVVQFFDHAPLLTKQRACSHEQGIMARVHATSRIMSMALRPLDRHSRHHD